LRYWEQGADVRGPREWLLAVARNACLDRLRRAGRTTSVEDSVTEERGDDREPLWHLQQRELALRLQRAIAALGEPQRSLVVLFDVHGLDGRACARILGISPTQVKVYLHRARRRLRRELEESR
jgi:RNA polymerase sigma-70 factor (ECF subfamily)